MKTRTGFVCSLFLSLWDSEQKNYRKLAWLCFLLCAMWHLWFIIMPVIKCHVIFTHLCSEFYQWRFIYLYPLWYSSVKSSLSKCGRKTICSYLPNTLWEFVNGSMEDCPGTTKQCNLGQCLRVLAFSSIKQGMKQSHFWLWCQQAGSKDPEGVLQDLSRGYVAFLQDGNQMQASRRWKQSLLKIYKIDTQRIWEIWKRKGSHLCLGSGVYGGLVYASSQASRNQLEQRWGPRCYFLEPRGPWCRDV